MTVVHAERSAEHAVARTTDGLTEVVRSLQGKGLVTVEAVADALGVAPSEMLRAALDAAVGAGLLERMQLYTRRHAGQEFRLVRVTYHVERLSPAARGATVADAVEPPWPVWPPAPRSAATAPLPAGDSLVLQLDGHP